MAMSEQTVTAIKSYQNQAQVLVKNYIIADPFIPYTSILAGLLACKVVHSFLLVSLYLFYLCTCSIFPLIIYHIEYFSL